MSADQDRERMERCASIASQLIRGWETTGSFAYTLRATGSIGGKELRELRQQTFLLGLGDDLTEVSLADVLTVFSILEQRGLANQHLEGQPPGTYSFTAHVPPEFSDVEAVRVLSQLRIETPYDEGEVAQFLPGKRPAASGEAGGPAGASA